MTDEPRPFQRVLALVILLAAGTVSLPFSAYFLDDQGTENLILPAALGGMVLLGAVVGALLPGLARGGSSRARAARVGAIIGVVVTVVGTLIFFLLLSGFDGA
jgi:lysylphosphatidylglycerol synthetase-like protein (DUF2156 family)